MEVANKVKESKKKKQRIYPCRSNRASQIGHPCERYLVYMRTSWDKQELPSVEKEFIFEGGRFIEKLALNDLEEAGFELSNQGRDFEDKKLGITGHVDTMIRVNGTKVPCEIKGISPFDFDKINEPDDMLKSKKTWIRGYPAQLQMYLYLCNRDIGLFYLKNKLTYEPKEIWMGLDYEYCEELLKKAERINTHVANNTLPDRISEYDTCSDCAFKHICLPDLKNLPGIEFMDNAAVEEKIDRLEELKPFVKEHKALDEEIKKLVEGKENISCGKYLISGKWVKKIMPPQPEKTIQYWQKKIIRI